VAQPVTQIWQQLRLFGVVVLFLQHKVIYLFLAVW
jgi:hypothetical protein